MKNIKADAPTAVLTPTTISPFVPYFKPRRLVNEINFHLKITALACLAVGTVSAQAFEPVLQLASLDSSTGFRLDGATVGDRSGFAVSAVGDVNGDGVDDLVIGAPYTSANGVNSGSSYIVFGSSSAFGFGNDPLVTLSSLNGNTGFRLDGGTTGDRSGFAVSAAGDINHDGIDDVIIGARSTDHNGSDSGSSYVVFGSSSAFSSVIDLSSLDGSTGFRLDGGTTGDQSGYSVSAAGDINGDGIDDMLIGAFRTDQNGGDSGSSYVVFGSSSAFDAVTNLSSLNGNSGFRLDGGTTGDNFGFSVSSAGDINDDGIDDVMIGARGADHNGSFSGSSYVVFGSSSPFSAVVGASSLNGSTGFRLDGFTTGDQFGYSVSDAGDVNGDGIDDVIIGARSADHNGSDSGSSYVVFGKKSAFNPVIDLSSLNGNTGFRLDGDSTDDYSGFAVSAVGDINGDGIDDLMIGAPFADPNGLYSGSSYLVFGSRSLFNAVIDLSGLNGSTGFRLDGGTTDDQSGFAVSAAGDINNDGIDDLLIGALFADPNGSTSGSSYLVFGVKDIDDTFCVPIKTQSAKVAVICL